MTRQNYAALFIVTIVTIAAFSSKLIRSEVGTPVELHPLSLDGFSIHETLKQAHNPNSDKVFVGKTLIVLEGGHNNQKIVEVHGNKLQLGMTTLATGDSLSSISSKRIGSIVRLTEDKEAGWLVSEADGVIIQIHNDGSQITGFSLLSKSQV